MTRLRSPIRRGRSAVPWLALLLIAPGCSTFGGRKAPQAPFLSPQAPWDDGYKDFSGVLHVHTDYSHDAHGRFEDAMRAANAQGVDFVIFTEHDTLKPLREGRQGWHGATLALIGEEINVDAGHLLAVGITSEIDGSKLTTQQVIDEVARQGGLSFIAHPHFKKHPWKDWTVHGFTGTEIVNTARDFLDDHLPQLAMWTLSDTPLSSYLSLMDRPTYSLRTWDALIARHGRVTGIGSSDAHEFHLFGAIFAPYDMMFQLARTHVLLPSSTMTSQGIYEALRRGHAYVGIPLVAQTEGFSFIVHDGRTVLGVMGDELPYEPGLRLVTRLPLSADLALYRDGEEVATSTGQVWEIGVSGPGAYRVEATRDGKPWLFSNPIYVRPGLLPSPARPSTSSLTPAH